MDAAVVLPPPSDPSRHRRSRRISAARRRLLLSTPSSSERSPCRSSASSRLFLPLLCFAVGLAAGTWGTFSRDALPPSPLVRRTAATDLDDAAAFDASSEDPDPYYAAWDGDAPSAGFDADDIMARVPISLQLLLMAVLVCFSALFAGLTLGLMSLDKVGLEIAMSSEDAHAAACARQIYPIRTKDEGSLLLCTLLLGNVAVNSLLSIVMSDLTSGMVGFCLSTLVIVLFGEIIPQSMCSRHPLELGAKAVPLVTVIMWLMWPLSKPLAMCLNKLLGKEPLEMYSKTEIRRLLELHADHGKFDLHTFRCLVGSLRHADVPVRDVASPLDDVLSLSRSQILDRPALERIRRSGQAVVPVRRDTNAADAVPKGPADVVGMLAARDLVPVGPEEGTTAGEVLARYGGEAPRVRAEDGLGEVLAAFKRGSRAACVVDRVRVDGTTGAAEYADGVTGIVTLEDILEIIVGDELFHPPVEQEEGSGGGEMRCAPPSSKVLRMAAARLQAAGWAAFASRDPEELEDILHAASAVEEAEQGAVLYTAGALAETCCIVLEGSVVTTVAGTSVDRPPLSVLCSEALLDASYAPPFSATVAGTGARLLRIPRERYQAYSRQPPRQTTRGSPTSVMLDGLGRDTCASQGVKGEADMSELPKLSPSAPTAPSPTTAPVTPLPTPPYGPEPPTPPPPVCHEAAPVTPESPARRNDRRRWRRGGDETRYDLLLSAEPPQLEMV